MTEAPHRKPFIFISYRRNDTSWAVSRIKDALSDVFGQDQVFLDIDDMTPGLNFRGEVVEKLAACNVLLVVIGKQWLTAADSAGNPRLNDPQDLVRREVETGLDRDSCRVIPVLIDDTPLPTLAQLPSSLAGLVSKQFLRVRNDTFEDDVKPLIHTIKRLKRLVIPRESFLIGLVPLIACIFQFLAIGCGSFLCAWFPSLCTSLQCQIKTPVSTLTLAPSSTIALTLTPSMTTVLRPTQAATLTLSNSMMTSSDTHINVCDVIKTQYFAAAQPNRVLMDVAAENGNNLNNMAEPQLQNAINSGEHYQINGQSLANFLSSRGYSGDIFSAQMIIVSQLGAIAIEAVEQEAQHKAVDLASYKFYGCGEFSKLNGRYTAVIIAAN